MGDGGPATSAELSILYRGMAVDAAGNLYICRRWRYNRVREVDSSGTITTVAGTGASWLLWRRRARPRRPELGGGPIPGGGRRLRQPLHRRLLQQPGPQGRQHGDDHHGRGHRRPPGFSGDGGPATSAELNYPSGWRSTRAGNLYIADAGNNRIRKVDSVGDDHDGGGHGPQRLRRRRRPGHLRSSTIRAALAVDGVGQPLHRRHLQQPGPQGRRLRDDHHASAGTRHSGGFSGDGGPATAAELDRPRGWRSTGPATSTSRSPGTTGCARSTARGRSPRSPARAAPVTRTAPSPATEGPQPRPSLHRPYRGGSRRLDDIYIADSQQQPSTEGGARHRAADHHHHVGPGATKDPTPTYGFSSDEPGASFECRFDAAPFAVCSGPATHTAASPLVDGNHTFEVRAVDPAGNADPSPSSRSFTVDTVPPNTSIISGPSGHDQRPHPDLQFLLRAGARASSASSTRAPMRPAVRRRPRRTSPTAPTLLRSGDRSGREHRPDAGHRAPSRSDTAEVSRLGLRP